MACRLLLSFFLPVLFLPASALAQSSVREFQLGGSASVISEDCIRLTPDHQYVSGSAWFKQPIDLKEPFELRMSIVLGEKDLLGADGIVFVFHPTARTGWRGEGMGFGGLAPSLGIEFDTYQNPHLNDPSSDHVALMWDGHRHHSHPGLGLVEVDNLEDGRRHPLLIQWNPKTGELKVFLDGELRAGFRADIINSIFDGQSVVYWGMTAGTGRFSNYQDVCIERLFVAAAP